MTEEQFQKKLMKLQSKNKEIERKNELKKEKNKYKRFSFSKMKTSNKVLAASILAIILFSIGVLYIQYKTGYDVNDTLITRWFSFWTIEVGCLAGIKVSKVLKEKYTNGVD